MARNHSHPCHTVFFIYNALLLLLSLSVEGASRGGSGSQCALYEGFTDSRCLTSSNIDSSLRESKIGWVVEFYSSWCGHCHHFSPTWKKVASRIKGKARGREWEGKRWSNPKDIKLLSMRPFPIAILKNPHIYRLDVYIIMTAV